MAVDKRETEMLQNVATKFAIYFSRTSDPTLEQRDFAREATFHITRFLFEHKITEYWEEVTLDYIKEYEKHKNLSASKLMKFINPAKYIALSSNPNP